MHLLDDRRDVAGRRGRMRAPDSLAFALVSRHVVRHLLDAVAESDLIAQKLAP